MAQGSTRKLTVRRSGQDQKTSTKSEPLLSRRRIPNVKRNHIAIGGCLGTLWVLYLTWPELGLDPSTFPRAMARAWTERLEVFAVHVVSSLLALPLGALMFHPATRRWRVHRHMGILFAPLSLLAALSGICLAGSAYGGPVARWGFAGMGTAWLVCIALGLEALWRRDFKEHGDWMLSGLVVGFGAVLFRVMSRIGPFLGFKTVLVYQWSTWLCWLPGLLLCRYYLKKRRPMERNRT